MPPKKKGKPKFQKNPWSQQEHEAFCQLLRDKRAEEEERGLDHNTCLTGTALWNYIADRLSECRLSSIDRLPHECRLYWATSGRKKSGFDERSTTIFPHDTEEEAFEELPLLERVIKKLQENHNLHVKNQIDPNAHYVPKAPREILTSSPEWDSKSPVVCVCQWKNNHAGMPCIGCPECCQFKHIPCLVKTEQIGRAEASDPKYRYLCTICKANMAKKLYGDPKDNYFSCSCYYSSGITKPCVRCRICGVYKHVECMVKNGEISKEYEAFEKGYEYFCKLCKKR